MEISIHLKTKIVIIEMFYFLAKLIFMLNAL